MTTTANTKTESKKSKKAAKPSKFMLELANKCLAKLGDAWSMTIKSSLMYDGTTQHYFYYVMDEKKLSIISARHIRFVAAFAEMVDSYGWYIHKDFETDQLSFEVSVSHKD